jgi:hypothetical protein
VPAADCTCIVAGIDALPSNPLDADFALDLDLLLLERGAVAVLQYVMMPRSFFTGADAELLD